MRGAATILSAGVLGAIPGAAAACVIELPQCPTAGGIAYLYEHAGSVVLFNEWLTGTGASRSILVECDSRQGVMVADVPDDFTRLQDAEEYFSAVMHDDEAQTLDQVARTLRRRGIDAVRVSLSPDHCGCDLPSIPPPPTFCPVD